MYNREYKKALKILRKGAFLKPPEGGRDRLLDLMSDRRAGIVSNSVVSTRNMREFRFISRFKYALVAMLLIISLFNTVYLMTGGIHAIEHRENSLLASRIIDELIIDTTFVREFSNTAKMLIEERGETDEI